MPAQIPAQMPTPAGLDALLQAVRAAARRVGQQPAASARWAASHQPDEGAPDQAFLAAWVALGLQGQPEPLDRPQADDLPFAVWWHSQWVCAVAPAAPGGWQALGPNDAPVTLPALDGLPCLRLPQVTRASGMPQAGSAGAPPPSPSGQALSRVWAALRPHRRPLVEALLATALVNLLALLTSLYSMQVYDRVIPTQGQETLWVLTVGVSLAISLELLLKLLRTHLLDHSFSAADQQLSGWFFTRMLAIRMEHRPATVGTLASQVRGFETVRGVMAASSVFVLVDVPFALLFLVVIYLIGGPVAWVPLWLLPLALGLGWALQAAIRQASRQGQQHAHRKAGLLVEAADGAETLKAHAAEWTLAARWQQLVREAAVSDNRVRERSALAQNLAATLQQLAYVAVMATGAWLATRQEITSGALLACSILSNRALMPVVQLPAFMAQWCHARAALDGLDQVLALPSEQDDAAHQLLAPVAHGGLQLEAVRFAYDRDLSPVLSVDRLVVNPGDRIGLLGPAGAGKSTLLKVASGLYRPDSGRVRLSGLDMAQLQPAVVRGSVGYLPQDLRLMSGTLRDNLVLGLADPGDEAVLAVARHCGLGPLLEGHALGLSRPISEGGRGVSGGQRQLVGLARLLLARPQVWLLDEPTGALDAELEQRLLEQLVQSWKPDDSAIVSTHKTSLMPLFNRLWVMHNGRVVLDGPRDDILRRLQAQGVASPRTGRAGAPASPSTASPT